MEGWKVGRFNRSDSARPGLSNPGENGDLCSGHPNLEHLAHHGDTENTEFFIGFSVVSVPPWLELCGVGLFNNTLTTTENGDLLLEQVTSEQISNLLRRYSEDGETVRVYSWR
jgi:hypothetical protein